MKGCFSEVPSSGGPQRQLCLEPGGWLCRNRLYLLGRAENCVTELLTVAPSTVPGEQSESPRAGAAALASKSCYHRRKAINQQKWADVPTRNTGWEIGDKSRFCSSCRKAASFQILRLLTRLHAVSGGHCQQEERVRPQEQKILM